MSNTSANSTDQNSTENEFIPMTDILQILSNLSVQSRQILENARDSLQNNLWVLAVIVLLIILWYSMHIVYLKYCKIKWNQIIYGPAIFLYTYHVGSYFSIDQTFNKLIKSMKESHAREKLRDELTLSPNELKLFPASLYVQSPEVLFLSLFLTSVISDLCVMKICDL